MPAIWLLSTRGRPRDAQATIDACEEAGMTSPGLVYVDEDDGAYDRLRLPVNWTIHREPKWLSLQGSMSWCFDNYPDATAYGWLADDTRPRTEGFDRILEREAGDWRLVCARDLWFSEDPWERAKLEDAHNLSSGLCWGGNLVRAAGWWALPGVRQAGIDTAWLDLVKPLRLHKYVHEVTVEHLNWRTGKRPYDTVDEWERDGIGYIEQDFVTKAEWLYSDGYREALRRIAAGAPNPAGVELDAARYEIRLSEINEAWRERNARLPASRVEKMLAAYREVSLAPFLNPDADEGPARLAAPVRPVSAGANLR